MIDLGKYAFDVILAYGISLGLLIGVSLFMIGRARRTEKELPKIQATYDALRQQEGDHS